MKRNGNIIEFASDEQHRRFVRAVAIGSHLEDMIKAALTTSAEMRYESSSWWRQAERLCGEYERPIYDYLSETLRIETTEPVTPTMPNLAAIDHLYAAKAAAIEIRDFNSAQLIRTLIDDIEAAKKDIQ